MTQFDLFEDQEEAKMRFEAACRGAVYGDKAIEQVEANADDAWKACVEITILKLAEMRDRFTTDAVWAMMERDFPCEETHEPRALGAIMRSCSAIRATDQFSPSVRPECHRRPLRVWKSLVRG